MRKKMPFSFVVILAAFCVLGLAACGGTEGDAKYKVRFIADGVTVRTVETAGNETIALPDAPNQL